GPAGGDGDQGRDRVGGGPQEVLNVARRAEGLLLGGRLGRRVSGVGKDLHVPVGFRPRPVRDGNVGDGQGSAARGAVRPEVEDPRQQGVIAVGRLPGGEGDAAAGQDRGRDGPLVGAGAGVVVVRRQADDVSVRAAVQEEL